MSRDEIEDLLYQGYQGRRLEEGVRRSGFLQWPEHAVGIDTRSIVISRTMKHAVDGRGDLCCPGPMSPGPALAFGATPLEFLRQLAHRGTSPAAARAGGLSWTDLRRGLIGWDGPPGMMTQVLAGAALAFAQRGENRAALVFESEKALDTGGWHEGLNLAAARRVPIIVVLVASGSAGVGRVRQIEEVARAYGIKAVTIDQDSHAGIFATLRGARRRAALGGGPTLVALEGATDDRWQSHEEFASWALTEGHVTEGELESIRRAAAAGVDHAFARIVKEPGPEPHDALAAVRIGSPPLRPWTRLKSPRPDGVAEAPMEGPSVN
ncbi:MAG: hypothetical protein F4Y07_03430 [Gemmatimonadetes bacterium]|nr:hypothetical protein [Gemmatimonadota bacterium]MYE15513.1 hypothetical protein [Gemmatimonadota bacterium]